MEFGKVMVGHYKRTPPFAHLCAKVRDLIFKHLKSATETISCSKYILVHSQLNRNKNHVINLLLHEELSWRLLTKLPESISTFQLPQKMWSQASVPWGCSKTCLEQEIVPVTLFKILKIRSLTFAFIFDHEDMTLESFCTSGAQIMPK